MVITPTLSYPLAVQMLGPDCYLSFEARNITLDPRHLSNSFCEQTVNTLCERPAHGVRGVAHGVRGAAHNVRGAAHGVRGIAHGVRSAAHGVRGTAHSVRG